MSGALFGSPGTMIEFFPWEEKQSVAHHRSLSIHETIGGGSYAFRGPKTRRTWSLSNDELSPEEYRDLELLLYDSSGIGPFWLIDQEARVTNALTPAQSLPGAKGVLANMAGDISPSGTIELPGGFSAPAAVSSGGTVYFRFDAPVVPGVPITLSVYGTPGATVHIRYLAPDGSSAGTGGTITNSSTDPIVRYYQTVVPPPTAVAVYLILDGISLLAAPAITYTDSLQPWGVGKGCNQAVLSSWSRDFDRMSSSNPERRYVSVSLKIEEVGPSA